LHADYHAIQREAEKVLELLRGCSLVVSAAEAVIHDLQVIYEVRNASERVQDEVQSELQHFVAELGPQAEATDHLHVRFRRRLRDAVLGGKVRERARLVLGGQKRVPRGMLAGLQRMLAGLPAAISEESARGIVDALIGRPASEDGAAEEAVPGPTLEDFPPKLQKYVDRFETLLRDETRDFEGRDWVFEKVHSFVQQMPSGYFVMRGDPGVGKTAFMAKMVKEWHLPVYHFNIVRESRNTRRRFLGNVCAALIAKFGMPYDDLPAEFDQDGSFFSRLLEEVRGRLEDSEKLIIAIDALDEVQGAGGAEANPLCLPAHLPEGVYAVVTARHGKDVSVRASNVKEWTLDHDADENKEDVRSYVRKHLSKGIRQWMAKEGLATDAFVSLMVEKSEGNFMYLYYVLPEIGKGNYKDATLDAIPAGLTRYYEDHWRRMKMTEKPLPRTKITVVYILSLIPKPVSCGLLAEFAHADELVVQEILDDWEAFLSKYPQDGDPVYSIYHASFREFLHRKDIVRAAGVSLRKLDDGMIDNLLGT
jgi:hypothetical protein